MTILNFETDGFSPHARKQWASIGNYTEIPVTEFRKLPTLDDVEVIIIRLKNYIGREIIDCLPNLKYIVTATTGLDHIDVECAKEREIFIVSLRGETEFLNTISSTSEHAWALLLSLVRYIPQSVTSVRNGLWERDRFRGIQLKRKVIGIIGLGRTGKMVAEYARSFGMDVTYFDPFVTNVHYYRHSTLEELLGACDVITLHVHLQNETENLLNADRIELMKSGSYFINTSRGKLVDECALVKQMEIGRIRGVATDVLSSELTDIKESPLYQAMTRGLNVIITPHLGGATWDAMHLCEEFIVNKFAKIYN
jgi:D-3-phosphoglycerate dehydrogenase